MDELRFDREDDTIYITEMYSERPLITIYESLIGGVTFEMTDGEYTAALSIADVNLLIEYLQEIVRHEDK